MKKAVYLIIGIGTILAIAAVVIAYFCFRKIDFEVFYNESSISEQTYGFDSSESYSFTVKGRGEYTVKVLPNANKDFSFTLNDEKIAFSSVEDLTLCFDVVRAEEGFTIIMPSEISIKALLEKVYPDTKIELSDKFNSFDSYFILCAISEDGTEIKCSFGINGIWIDSYKVVF